MWTGLAAGVLALSGAIVFREILRSRNLSLAFLLFALWLRYALSAFPAITHPKLIAGLSINALGSLLIVGLGLLLIPKRFFWLKLLGPFYLFAFFVFCSGVVNVEIGGFIEATLRLCFMLVIQLSLISALMAVGWERTVNALMLVFILPVTLQILSIAVGHSTQSVDSLGRSFIGGYGHESGFAMILLTMLLVAAFWNPRAVAFKALVMIWVAIGLILANYRTGILSALPIMGAILFAGIGAATNTKERAFGLTAAALLIPAVAIVLILNSPTITERFAALGQIFEINLEKSAFEYTRNDQDKLTGRLYIWRLYLDGFINAEILQKTIGSGPESWTSAFHKYAHNTFISYLYEYGIIGLVAFITYWLHSISMSLQIRDGWMTLKFLSAYIGFTILNFATMPLWQISGVIFFGLLNGFVAYAVLTASLERRRFSMRPANTEAF